jgi:hypothetical protein
MLPKILFFLLSCAALQLAACHSRQSHNVTPSMTSAQHLQAIQRVLAENAARPNPAALKEIRAHLEALRAVVSTEYHRTKLNDISEWAEALYAHPEKYPGETKDLTDYILFDCRMLETAGLSPGP